MTSDDLDGLLCELRRRKWTLVRWGHEDSPELLAALYQWGSCCDVVILRAEDDASAYRSPPWRLFDPETVFYQVHGTAVSALRIALSLPPPNSPGAPMWLKVASDGCRLPTGLPTPMVVRPL